MDKIDKLWELMQDVDSLEDIYETEEGYIAFVFDIEGNADDRVAQIMKGLDKEGYMNSFEETNGSATVILFDIDFEDEFEEGFENPEGKEIPSAPTEDNAGIANLINALIKDEWDAIDGYQSAIMNIKSYSDDTDSVRVLEEIANDEYAHVGNLQKILNRFAPQASTIADGAKEAEATIKEFS